jgi:hypothetical protein
MAASVIGQAPKGLGQDLLRYMVFPLVSSVVADTRATQASLTLVHPVI